MRPSATKLEAVSTDASKNTKHQQQKQAKLKKQKQKKKPKKPSSKASSTKSAAKQKASAGGSHIKKPPKVVIPEDFEVDWENMDGHAGNA